MPLATDSAEAQVTVPTTVPEIEVAPRTFRGSFERVFEELAARGDLVWVECGRHRFLVVNGPDHVKELMIDRAEHLVKHSQLIEAGHRPRALAVYGGGISVPLFRGALARAMGPARIPDVLAGVASAAGSELARWRDGMSLPLMASMRRVSAASACSSSFASSLSAGELARAGRAVAWADLESRVTSPATRTWERLKLYPLRRRIALSRLTELGRSLIDNADLSQRTQLTAVVEDLPKFHPSVDRQQQNALVGELFQGAAAPLAQTAAWTLLRLSTEKQAAEQLRAEWKRVLLPLGGPVDREALRDLRYTEAFIREVTRFHPTNARIVRAAMVDTEIDGEPTPAGTRVVVNVHGIHNDPRFYEEPQQFAPERWLDGRPNAHKFSYLGFGVGSRRCLGENMAMVSLVALLPVLARDWDFDVDRISTVSRNRHQPSERMRVTLRAR